MQRSILDGRPRPYISVPRVPTTQNREHTVLFLDLVTHHLVTGIAYSMLYARPG